MRAHAVTARELSGELLQEHGLSVSAYEALRVLSGADEQRMKRVELAERLVLTPSGVTRLLDGLEKAGLVERVACPEDLRISYTQLTEAGEQKLEAASCGHVRLVRSVLEEHLRPDEIAALAELLEKLPGGPGDDTCPTE